VTQLGGHWVTMPKASLGETIERSLSDLPLGLAR
jgi:hypothetical protein